MSLSSEPSSSAMPFISNPERPEQQRVLNPNIQVGSNYRPTYIPHPSAVPDPYAHWHEVPQSQSLFQFNPLYAWKIPRLSLKIDDVLNPAVDIFLRNYKPQEALRNAVVAVLECLYTFQSQPLNITSLTLILRDFDGIAHTTSSAGNDGDKEIHYSTRYIKDKESTADIEIPGVIVHEMVHCYQYNAGGTCPRGLVEGIADFVRLRASLAPPHWKRITPSAQDKWDAGYERTAFFLDWIESVIGPGTIQAINEGMRRSPYEDGQVWRDVTGQSVEDLWIAYRARS